MFEEIVDELVGLSDAELAARIDANELERRRLDAEMAAALAVAERRRLHDVDGHRSMAAYCRARLNWSSAEAARRLGTAAAVDTLPGLGEAWILGRIGQPQAAKLSQARANPRAAEAIDALAAHLLGYAEQMPYRQFASVVDHAVRNADQDGAHDARDAAIEGRDARLVDVGGSLDVRAAGGHGVQTHELLAIHQRFVDAEYRADVAARRAEHGDDADAFPLARTTAQRRFDALVAIFRSGAAAADAGLGARPASAVVNIVVDANTWGRMLLAQGLSTSSDADGNEIDPFTGLPLDDLDAVLGTPPEQLRAVGLCRTDRGVDVHPHDVLRAALAGHVRRVVVDAERVVIDLGRRQRLFTGNARLAATLLATRCEHAGCDLPAHWCDVDHVREWSRDGGATDQSNAAVLCRSSNNAKHRMRWRTRRARNGCTYTIDEHGRVMLPVGAREPVFEPDPHDDADVDDEETPERIALLASLTRRRLDALPRPAWCQS